MKNISYIIVLISIVLCSCTFEEENIFDKSPAERMNIALQDYDKVLTAATNGWLVEYFPTDTTEGYSFIMKFDTSKKVTMAAKNRWVNNVFTRDSCVYDLIGDNGPLLSFPMAGSYKIANTEIGIFHLFSNPQYPKGGSSLDGYGLQGDYEFIFQSVTDTLIVLKGKKRGTYVRMYPIAANKTWQSLFADLDQMRSDIIGNSAFPLYMLFQKDTFVLNTNLKSYGEKTAKFRIVPKGGNSLIDGVDYAYIITPKGLRLHTEFEHKDAVISEFVLSSDKLRLNDVQSKNVNYIYGTNPIEFFNSNTLQCNIVLTATMGSKMRTIVDQIAANCQTKYKEKLTDLYFKYNATRQKYTVSFKSGKYTGVFDFSKNISSQNSVSFQYLNTKDANGDIYLKNIEGFQLLVTYLSQSFTVLPAGGMGSTNAICTAVADPEISFTIAI